MKLPNANFDPPRYYVEQIWVVVGDGNSLRVLDLQQ